MQRKGFLAACAGALAALGLPLAKAKAPVEVWEVHRGGSVVYTYVGDTALTVDGMQNAFVLSSMAMFFVSHDGIYKLEDGKKTKLSTVVAPDVRRQTGFNWYGA